MKMKLARGEHILVVPERWQDDMRIDHPPECPMHTDHDRLRGTMTVRYNCDVAVLVQADGDVSGWFRHYDTLLHHGDDTYGKNVLMLWPGRYVIECTTIVYDSLRRRSALCLAQPPEGQWLWTIGEALFKAPQDRSCAGVVASIDGAPAVFTGLDGNIHCRRCGWRLDEHDGK